MLEGWLANGIAAGGQLTTTHEVENFPGFPEGIVGGEICERFRAQSLRFGTKIFSETVTRVDLSSRPFHIFTGAQPQGVPTGCGWGARNAHTGSCWLFRAKQG
jgi:thioredoxin reductase